MLFYTAAAYYAIKIMPVGKWEVYILCQLPPALQMATAFTYDTANFSLLLLLLAVYLNVILRKRKIGVKWVLVFFALSTLAFPIKYAYLFFGLLFCTIPREQFEIKNVNRIKAAYIFVNGIMLMNQTVIGSVKALLPVNRTLKTAAVRPVLNGNAVENIKQIYHTGNFRTVNFFFEDKLRIAEYTFHTFWEHMDDWWNGIAGYKMGWGDALIPDFVLDGFLILLLLAMLSKERDGPYLEKRNRLILAAAAAGTFGALLGIMLLFCTPVWSEGCPSLNSRYLLPVIPLISIACKNKNMALEKPVPEKIFVWGINACHVFAVLYIFAGYVGR